MVKRSRQVYPSKRKKPGRKSRASWNFQWKILTRIFFAALLIAFLITHFLLSSTRVEGRSMAPTLQEGDRLFVDKMGTQISALHRGDIIVFRSPDENKDYIKRIIAFPQEYVQIDEGLVYINGKRLDEPYIDSAYTHTSDHKEWYVGEDQVFVLGDNRAEGASRDSRAFGPIERSALKGHAFFRYLPIGRMGGMNKDVLSK